MADHTKQENGRKQGEDTSSLDALSRTLEELEQRLSRVTAAKTKRERTQASDLMSTGDVDAKAARAPRPTFSDAVSQIVMRQKMLDREPMAVERRPSEGQALDRAPDGSESDSAGTAAMADLSRQLLRLREELRDDMTRSLQPRFDDMRAAFDELRKMIAARASVDQIGAEIARVDDGLTRMVDSGADRETIRSLREELEAMRDLVGQMAREESVQSVGRRWDTFETKLAGKAEEEAKAKRDLKDELERLRTSLGTLASEEHVKAVERRWDEFESRYLSTPSAGEGVDLSDLLKTEMNNLREKLETLASEKSIRAVEERWGALEERFASREIEDKIEAMGERMVQLENALGQLPQTLAIGPLERRVHDLAVGVEAIARRQQDESELDHFALLDERLDEISRAIMAATTRVPAIDMTPVERIEARLQSLTARVDELVEGGDPEVLSARIGELADRIETLSSDEAARDLAERIERFSGQLESLVAASEGGPIESLAIESRLQSLAQRLDEVSAPRVDEDLIKALEAQITRLSQQIGGNGMPAAMADPELDQRLAAIERRLDEHREDIIESARAAADEAIRQMMESGDLRQSEHVARLSDDLRALEALSRESGAQSEDFFRTVHSTLMKLVDRIDQIEVEITGKPRVTRDAPPVSGHPPAEPTGEVKRSSAEVEAPGLRGVLARTLKGRKSGVASGPSVRSPLREDDPELMLDDADVKAGERGPVSAGAFEAPSLDAADIFDSPEANLPLAIGSGTPDVTALLERVRAQQAGRSKNGEQDGKADFIAAARRAAMAAAAEAESLNRPESEQETDKARLTDIVSRRRKPILMAVGAVLLALMALPLGQALTGSSDVNGASEPDILTADRPASPAKPDAATATRETPAPEAEAKQTAGKAPAPTMPEGLILPAASSSAPKPMLDGSGTSAGIGEARAPLTDDASQASLVSRSLPEKPAVAATSVGPAAAIPPMPEELGNEALANAVEDEDPKALFEIGLRLMEGRKTEPDAKAAAEWFAYSADRGFAPAQYSLGTLYEKGNGVPRDTSVARDWYVKAATQGNVRAMHNLAVLYATGVDGKSEPKLAALWFERAAEHGMTDSQYNLGILYARGAGVEQDLTDSFKWFSVVASAGDEDAGRKRDEIRKSLTPEQIEQAEAKVAAFKPKPREEAVNTVEMPKAWTDKEDVPIHTSSIDMTRAVRNIQAILIKLGFDPGAPDGVAGARTTEAIKSFQKEAGLQPTGDINESLIRALLARKDG